MHCSNSGYITFIALDERSLRKLKESTEYALGSAVRSCRCDSDCKPDRIGVRVLVRSLMCDAQLCDVACSEPRSDQAGAHSC